MAGAVPAFLEAVPVHDAADVRAHGRATDDLPTLGTIDRDLRHAVAHDTALVRLQLILRADLARTEMFGQVLYDPRLAAGATRHGT